MRALRCWANELRFEPLKNQVARQFATTDEPDWEAQAANWRKELELRVQVINDQLTEMNQHREILVTETLGAAGEALALLRSAAAQSRLPDHFPRLGGAQFLRIATHEPESPAEQRGRIGELIDELVDQGDIPLGIKLVQQAVRRLAKPIRVKVLNPDPDLEQDAVDITDMARFSGGEQLTSAILLYCSLAQLRARNRGIYRKPSSVLILDNPIGRASRVRFLELQRDAATQEFRLHCVSCHRVPAGWAIPLCPPNFGIFLYSELFRQPNPFGKSFPIRNLSFSDKGLGALVIQTVTIS